MMKKILLFCLAFAIILFASQHGFAQTCNLPKVTNLKFVQTGKSSGSVSWNAVNGAVAYQVDLIDVTVPNKPNTISKNVTSNSPFSFSNLLPNIIYQINIRAICSNNIISNNLSFLRVKIVIVDDIYMNPPTPPCGTPSGTFNTNPEKIYKIAWNVNNRVLLELGSSRMIIVVTISNTLKVYGLLYDPSKSYRTYNLGNNCEVKLHFDSGHENEIWFSSTNPECKATITECKKNSFILENGKQISNNKEYSFENELSELNPENQPQDIVKIELAPNPFTNQLHLNIENVTVNQVLIINQLGQVVKQIASNIDNNTNTLDIDTSNLIQGYYYCIVKTANKDYTYKVIKIE